MFEVKKSDFAVTICGYTLIAFASMVFAICALMVFFKVSSPEINFVANMGLMIGKAPVLKICGVLCLAIGAFALYNAFLTDGALFALFGLTLFCTGGFPIAVGFSVLYLIIAYMAYREMTIDTAIIAVIMALVSMLVYGLVLKEMMPLVLIVGIACAAVAATASYVAVSEWMGAQEYIQECKESFFGAFDDDCKCKDCSGDCDDCTVCDECCTCKVDNCDCSCHKGVDCENDDCACACHTEDCKRR